MKLKWSLHVCSRCGRPLEDASEYTALCADCRRAAKAESIIRPRACRDCGAIFEGGPRAWYCPDCRLERRRKTSREHRRHGPARKLGSIQICERCGREYVLEGGRQRYCPACAPDAVREAVAPHKREQAIVYNHRNRPSLKQGVRLCVVCGNEITSSTATNVCSQACRDYQRKLNQYKADLMRGCNRRPPERGGEE